MLIDCDTCRVRDLACGDCVVTVLLGPRRADLDGEEQAAIAVLASSGLVPPLRLVTGTDARSDGEPAVHRTPNVKGA
jgi:hypothetical protein